MRAIKFAISVPAETMGRVDGAAKRLGMTRSRYISTVLSAIARRERDRAITTRIDEVLQGIETQDLEAVAHLTAASSPAGTEW